VVEEVMASVPSVVPDSLEAVLAADAQARHVAYGVLDRLH